MLSNVIHVPDICLLIPIGMSCWLNIQQQQPMMPTTMTPAMQAMPKTWLAVLFCFVLQRFAYFCENHEIFKKHHVTPVPEQTKNWWLLLEIILRAALTDSNACLWCTSDIVGIPPTPVHQQPPFKVITDSDHLAPSASADYLFKSICPQSIRCTCNPTY